MSFAGLTVKNLLRQRVRTILTLVGITLGITTVVALGVITAGLKNTAGASRGRRPDPAHARRPHHHRRRSRCRGDTGRGVDDLTCRDVARACVEAATDDP